MKKLSLTLFLFLSIIFVIKATENIYMSSSTSYTVCSANFYDGEGPTNDYLKNQNIIVTLYPSTPGAKVSVTFDSFNTQVLYDDDHFITHSDILYVFNGNSITSPQIGAMQGIGYGTVTSTAVDGSLTFKFVSYTPRLTPASGVRAGWSATISCNSAPPNDITMIGGTFTTCGGKFYDAGGPNGDYMYNQNTTLTLFPATPGAKISVTFDSFKTQVQYDDDHFISQDDILYVYNGNSKTTPKIGELQGQGGYGTITSTSPDGSLTFQFVSNAPRLTPASGSRAGWSATISCSSVSPNDITMIAGTAFTTCGGKFYDSGGPNGDYMNNQNSTLTLYPATPGAKVSVTFDSFKSQVQYDDDHFISHDDILYVYNGNNISAPKIGALQGQGGYGTITSTSPDGSLTFKFVSNAPRLIPASGSRAGWSATISCSSAPPDDITMIAGTAFTTCGGKFYDSGGPNGDYMNNQNSTLTLNPATPGAKVSVTFDSFNTQVLYDDAHFITHNDILYIFNGNSIAAPQIAALQGLVGPRAYNSTASDGSLTFKFVSFAPRLMPVSGTRSGWSATIACNLTSTEVSWNNQLSGGIAVKVIETSGTNNVKFVGFEYEYFDQNRKWPSNIITENKTFPVTNSRAFIEGYPAPPDLITKFKSEIILYDANKKKIGHIPFKYNPKTEYNKCHHAILFLHNDYGMCKDGSIKYFPYGKDNPFYPKLFEGKWEYFSDGEYPVSMLIPPNDRIPDIYNKDPMLFVHGVEGTYPYWKPTDSGEKSTVDLINEKGYDGWQIYYPKNMDIAHSSKCLKNDIEFLSKNLYNSKKIKVVTHSMGGLITMEYLTSDPVNSKKYIEKVLLTVPPIHGSLGSNLHYKASGGYMSQLFENMDREAPCYRDMSLGSEFIWNLHYNRDWTSLDLNEKNNGIADDIFVLIGSTKKEYLDPFLGLIKGGFAEEALNHNDIIVAMSSASLLEHRIGFATMYGNHNDGRFYSVEGGNIQDKMFLPNFIATYFKSESYSGFIASIKSNTNIQAIVNPDKTIVKPENGLYLWNLKTNEEEVDYQKGIITFEYPGSKVDVYNVYTDLKKEKLLINDIPDKWDFATNDYGSKIGEFKRNKFSNKYYFSSQDGCALNLRNGNIALTANLISGSNAFKIFEFTNCQTSHFTIEPNLLASNNNGQSIIKKAFIRFFSSNKNASIQTSSLESINDTVVYVDNQTAAVNFTLQSWEANEKGIPITMRLRMPDETEIGPTSPNIAYTLDPNTGLHQILISKPMSGTWHIWAESNHIGVETMKYIARAYFLSDILAYSANDSTQIASGRYYNLMAGLKINKLSLLDTASLKVIAKVTSPTNISHTYNLSDSFIVNDTSYIFRSDIPIDTIGYHIIEIAFEGIYNGFRFERQIVIQIQGLDNKTYFNLPAIELNENNISRELFLPNFIHSSANIQDTIHFTQRIISSTLKTAAYKVIIDSLKRSVVFYTDVSDTGKVKIEYAFHIKDNIEVKDTLNLFINQVYPHPVLSSSATEICLGDPVRLTASGADTYLWSTKDSISSVLFYPIETKIYHVKAKRNGYSVEDSISVAVNTFPEVANKIFGNTQITSLLRSSVYSTTPIKGATSYKWVLPPGAIGESTADTILIYFKEEAVSGEIKVNGHNACGDGKESFLFINVNRLPIANAGTDQSVNECATVTLDGSASSDPDNNTLTYLWTAPTGITLSSRSASKPTFTAPEIKKDTILNFTLIVNDGFTNSASSSVKISVKNVIKTAADDLSQGQFKIYPNPTNGIFRIEGMSSSEETHIEVYTIDGRLIVKKAIISSTCEIDISKQIAGTYLVYVNRQTLKIVKK